MVKEILYKDSGHNSSDSFGGVKWRIIEGIKNIFGYNSKDKKIINYATENRMKGKVIVNYVNDNQKYILGVDSYNQKLVFITDNLPHHINIKHKYIADGLCLGGGRVVIDDKNKTISLHGKSRVYGSISEEPKKAMIKMLENTYPDYTISLK